MFQCFAHACDLFAKGVLALIALQCCGENLTGSILAATICNENPKPNIVLIYSDDVGYGDVSCNGQTTLKTTNIDRIAAQGLRMTDAHCSAATCTPSRFALLTGTYAFRQKGTGIAAGDANMVIKTGTTTMASVLQTAGYQTGVVGKWHLGLGDGPVDWNKKMTPGPNEIGFDYHFLIPATGDRVPCVYLEQGRVVDLDPADPIQVSYKQRIDPSPSGAEAQDRLKQKWSHGHNQTIVNGISRIGWMTGGQKARWIDEDMADVIVHKAHQFIDQHKTQRFFLFFSTHDIHVPRVPHSRFAGKSGLGPRGDAMLQLDWCVGQILDKLEQEKLTENTIVIFTSDNGPVLDDGYHDLANENLGNHLPSGKVDQSSIRGGKYSLFEGGTRIPMVIRWPGHIQASTTSDALFGQIDLARSLAMIAGTDIPQGACSDSRDAVDVLLGKSNIGRPHLIHEAGRLAIRMGDWKWIPAGKVRENLGPWTTVPLVAPGALYDLSASAAEQDNIASQNADQVNRMKEIIKKIQQAPDQPEYIGQ